MRALVWARALPQVKLCSNVECSTLLLFYLFLWAAEKTGIAVTRLSCGG